MKTELPHTRDVVSSCSIYKTTTNKDVGTASDAHEALVWPTVIPVDVQQKVIARLLALPAGMAQEILDEVTFKQVAGKASNPIGLLFGLIPIAEQGKFQITGGMDIAKVRRRNALPTLADQRAQPTDAEIALSAQRDFDKYLKQLEIA